MGELDFLSISNLNFVGYTGSKNPVRNRPKIKFIQLDFSNIFTTINFSSKQNEIEFSVHSTLLHSFALSKLIKTKTM